MQSAINRLYIRNENSRVLESSLSYPFCEACRPYFLPNKTLPFPLLYPQSIPINEKRERARTEYVRLHLFSGISRAVLINPAHNNCNSISFLHISLSVFFFFHTSFMILLHNFLWRYHLYIVHSFQSINLTYIQKIVLDSSEFFPLPTTTYLLYFFKKLERWEITILAITERWYIFSLSLISSSKWQESL